MLIPSENALPASLSSASGRQVRNASPSLLLAQKFLPIFRGAGSAHFAEHSGKVLLRLEAARHRDVQHTRLGGAQHFLSLRRDFGGGKLNDAGPQQQQGLPVEIRKPLLHNYSIGCGGQI